MVVPCPAAAPPPPPGAAAPPPPRRSWSSHFFLLMVIAACWFMVSRILPAYPYLTLLRRYLLPFCRVLPTTYPHVARRSCRPPPMVVPRHFSRSSLQHPAGISPPAAAPSMTTSSSSFRSSMSIIDMSHEHRRGEMEGRRACPARLPACAVHRPQGETTAFPTILGKSRAASTPSRRITAAPLAAAAYLSMSSHKHKLMSFS